MFSPTPHIIPPKDTAPALVIPFYVYAAVSFLTATALLLFSATVFTQHYFQPRVLAITHILALGWGTMMILGASHQLVPVLTGTKLFSDLLGYLSFILAGAGIPLLIYAFLHFRFGWAAQTGAILINAAVIAYLVNIGGSILKSKNESVHAVFIFTATLWLLTTTFMGLLLVFNFTHSILPADSLHYLSFHAHTGIIGWFLLLVTGVGSRLIPMFLISKYNNPRRLWLVYGMVNGGLLAFLFIFFFFPFPLLYIFPLLLEAAALAVFSSYCYAAYRGRIRKKVDGPVKISLLSVGVMVLPIAFLAGILIVLPASSSGVKWVLAYGFSIFFGWITAIILGMTFKTLPFIAWNRLYHDKPGPARIPNPKDLFSQKIFNGMNICYLSGFIFSITGIISDSTILLRTGAFLLLTTAVLYIWNVLKILTFKLPSHERTHHQ